MVQLPQPSRKHLPNLQQGGQRGAKTTHLPPINFTHCQLQLHATVTGLSNDQGHRHRPRTIGGFNPTRPTAEAYDIDPKQRLQGLRFTADSDPATDIQPTS